MKVWFGVGFLKNRTGFTSTEMDPSIGCKLGRFSDIKAITAMRVNESKSRKIHYSNGKLNRFPCQLYCPQTMQYGMHVCVRADVFGIHANIMYRVKNGTQKMMRNRELRQK